MLFDSHCHLTDEAFAADRDAVLARARDAGLVGMVCIASDAGDAAAALGLARAHADVWCTAGVHPHEAASATADALARVRELAAEPGVVAIGECGLDYHYDHAPRERQRQAFRAQLELAAEVGMPVVVHAREADDDTRALVQEFEGSVTGVLHCFTGGAELMEAGLDAGWYVSFSGIATFGSFRGQDLVRRVPVERLLVETDSPYLAPPPHRGKRNEPAFVARVAEAVAALRDTPPEALGRTTTDNARRFYGLDQE